MVKIYSWKCKICFYTIIMDYISDVPTYCWNSYSYSWSLYDEKWPYLTNTHGAFKPNGAIHIFCSTTYMSDKNVVCRDLIQTSCMVKYIHSTVSSEILKSRIHFWHCRKKYLHEKNVTIWMENVASMWLLQRLTVKPTAKTVGFFVCIVQSSQGWHQVKKSRVTLA